MMLTLAHRPTCPGCGRPASLISVRAGIMVNSYHHRLSYMAGVGLAQAHTAIHRRAA